jgi:hypothetical protein
MTSNIQVSGLCINCINNNNCGYQANHTKPVVFCEEFLCTDSLESERKLVREIENDCYPIESLPNSICCNCDNFETCGLQKSDDTVLNCEEYK